MESEHVLQPSWQAWQSPPGVRKKPDAHAAQDVPLLAVVHPGLHVHWEPEEQTPLRQLHVDGASATAGTRHLPEPVRPSSHLSQFCGHAWQSGPKKPAAHDSQLWPVKPVGQTHVPFAVHRPAPEHAGEQADDSRSTTDNWDWPKPDGS